MKKRLLLFAIAILFNSLTASAQSWLWGAQGVGGLKADLYANNAATNKTGNVYQTGSFMDGLIFGTTKLFTAAYLDAYLVKYDQNGNLLWATQSNSSDSGYAAAWSVATDDSDNSYITGNLSNITGKPFIGYTLFGNDTLSESFQLFLVKYDPNGKVVWARQPVGNTITDLSGAIALDKFGHEYITGQESGRSNGALLIKYDRNGNLVWAKIPIINNTNTYMGTGGTGITTDSYGNIYVTGYFQDSLAFGTYKLYSPNLGVFIAKLDSNGNVLWAQQSNHASFYVPQYFNDNIPVSSVATDGAGAVYLTGRFADTITFGSYTFTTPDPNTFNFYLVKYNPRGTIAWGKTASFNNSYSGWGSYSLCSDDSNHIYISGAGAGPPQADSFVFANDTITVLQPVNGSIPSFLLKLDSSGYVLCSSTLPTGGTNPNAVTSDPTGKFVYLGGSFYNNTLVLGKDSLTDNAGANDPYVGRWQPCNNCDLSVTASTPSPSICAGQSVPLIVSGGSTYTWNPAAGLSATTGNSVIATPSVTTTYTISASAGTCSATNTIVVTVNPNPVVSASPSPASYCPGGSSVLIASGGDTYTWSPSIALSATTGSSVTANPITSTVYMITGYNGGCTATTTDTVIVDSVPPLRILPQPPPLICPIIKTDTLWVASQGSDFTWSPSEGLSATTGISVIASPSVSVTYTVSGIDSLGCPATGTEPVTILQNANPPTFTQHNDTLISSALHDNQWYRNDTILLGDTGQYLIMTAIGNYYDIINNEANGCSASSDTVLITSLTGINQLTVESGQVTVYPNPFNNQLTVISNQLMDEIDITNELGQVLLKVPLEGFRGEIDLSYLPNGMYFISVINKTGRDVVPVVKQ